MNIESRQNFDPLLCRAAEIYSDRIKVCRLIVARSRGTLRFKHNLRASPVVWRFTLIARLLHHNCLAPLQGWFGIVTDLLTPAQRSAQMSRIRGRDTKPELIVRHLLHRIGYRYRLHVATLPGRPDLVFRSRKKVIFVHGCFWHQHSGCKDATVPKSRTQFWLDKLSRNVKRDQEQHAALVSMGWQVFTVWECEMTDQSLGSRLAEFLGSASGASR